MLSQLILAFRNIHSRNLVVRCGGHQGWRELIPLKSDIPRKSTTFFTCSTIRKTFFKGNISVNTRANIRKLTTLYNMQKNIFCTCVVSEDML
jgi:hypothetical protein